MACSTNNSAVAPLPSPEERPGADVVIYDGNCRFCDGQVRRLHQWDGRHRLAFLSLHDPQIAEKYPFLDHDQLMKAMVVVDGKGRRYAGAGAVRYLSRRLPCLWPLVPVLHIPGSFPLWRMLYRQVARSRYRWGRK